MAKSPRPPIAKAPASDAAPSPSESASTASLPEITKEFAKIGVISFGGAAAQIAMLHRLAVDDRKWISEQRFMNAYNFCTLLPGPEAQQLATYIGWYKQGWKGGLISGLLFVWPGALIMLGLSLLHLYGQNLPLVDGIFLGIKAAVTAIVVQAVLKIGKRALHTPLALIIAVFAFIGTGFLKLPFLLIMLVAAISAAFFLKEKPNAAAACPDEPAQDWKSTMSALLLVLALWLLPIVGLLLTLGGEHIFTKLGLFFSKLAVLSFGGAYALLAWLTDEAVRLGWVSTAEMMDGLGLAETTPGPTILVTQFIGFLAAFRDTGGMNPITAAIIGALLTTWVTFAPSFVWIFGFAPHLDRLLKNAPLRRALAGMTAAACGIVAWLAFFFAMNLWFGAVKWQVFGGIHLPMLNFASFQGVAFMLSFIAFLLAFQMKRGMVEIILAMAFLGVQVKLMY